MDNDLIVLVKKYFDKVNGNTYHSVQFEIDNKIYYSGKIYGYGRQYEKTFESLITNDENLQIYCEKNEIIHRTKGKLIGYPKYIVIENCKAKELKEIHEYK
tara:strand:+ start:191 stop:493 length:303 start_codon:yes stop_codon:yes gene_type:complete